MITSGYGPCASRHATRTQLTHGHQSVGAKAPTRSTSETRSPRVYGSGPHGRNDGRLTASTMRFRPSRTTSSPLPDSVFRAVAAARVGILVVNR